MKLNQALLAALVLGTSGVALANGGSFAPVPPPHHTGYFYIGAGVSVDMGDFDTDYNTSLVDVFDQDAGFFRTNNFDWSGDGVDGDLYVGYQMVFEDRYTLGIELFGLISSLKGDFDRGVVLADLDEPLIGNVGTADSGSIKMKDTLGIAILPGIKATESTTLYFRAAYVNSRFEVDASHTDFINVPNVFGEATTIAVSGHKNKGGIQLGAGAQVAVTNNVAIRVEGDWERYGSIDFAGAGVDFDGDSLVALNGSIKPTVLSAKVSAIYMFAGA